VRDAPVVVSAAVAIPRGELDVRASRAGGPGGQHVNTSSTRVEVRWAPARSTALDEAQRARVVTALAARLDADGWLRVVAADTRSQRQNRALAEERLAALVRRALLVPKARRPTRPGRAAREARLTEKRHQRDRKRDRRWRGGDD
jgi:ribosome-associated protein